MKKEFLLREAHPTGSGNFYLSSAQLKGLGLSSPTSTSVDGWIGLSSAYQSQFTGTPTSGKFDAIAAMEHEISEVMGRTGSMGNVYGSNIYTVTDLFRYKGNNPSNSLAGSPVRDLTPGAHEGVFSIDGGATNLGFYNKSDGSAGDYADWDTTMIGDPFGESAPGAPYSMTGNDVVQMAALGYNMSTQGKQLAAALHAYTSV